LLLVTVGRKYRRGGLAGCWRWDGALESWALLLCVCYISPFQEKTKLSFLDQPASRALGRDTVAIEKSDRIQVFFFLHGQIILPGQRRRGLGNEPMGSGLAWARKVEKGGAWKERVLAAAECCTAGLNRLRQKDVGGEAPGESKVKGLGVKLQVVTVWNSAHPRPLHPLSNIVRGEKGAPMAGRVGGARLFGS
jgi:hypothetical protein